MIGPQYELNDSIVADAKKYKVKAVYTITAEIDGEKVDREYLKKLDKERKPIDVEKLRQSVMEIVKREAVNPEIGWWDMTPEELRCWNKNDMLCIKTGDRFGYWYDFAEAWLHRIEVLDVSEECVYVKPDVIERVGESPSPSPHGDMFIRS